jgi:hypothetical protein
MFINNREKKSVIVSAFLFGFASVVVWVDGLWSTSPGLSQVSIPAIMVMGHLAYDMDVSNVGFQVQIKYGRTTGTAYKQCCINTGN